MQKKALFLGSLLVSVAGAAAMAAQGLVQTRQLPGSVIQAVQSPSTPSPSVAPTPVYQPAPMDARVSQALSDWNRLRQSDGLPFSSYASFLINHRGWPGEESMRKTAERAADPLTSSPAEVASFFRTFPPLTATGHARYAFALLSTGQTSMAQVEAKAGWTGGSLSSMDEGRLLGQFSSALTPDDHDKRMDMLLMSKDVVSAQRQLVYTSPARRPIFETRLALQMKAPDAATRLASLGTLGSGDPGLLMDRAYWLRDGAQEVSARQLLASRPALTSLPANPEKWYETLLAFARAAAADRQWSTAYQIASQLDDAYAPGVDVSLKSLGERDDYTSLAWLAGTAALHNLNRPADATAMFVRYAKGGRSAQVTAKGYYWAGRAALQTGQVSQANGYFEQAAAYPEIFYGQLALERLGRSIPAPPSMTALTPPTAAERTGFAQKELVRATRTLGLMGRWQDQSTFVRTLADRSESQSDRILAAELASQISRPDLSVWLARDARNSGSAFYVRDVYPEVAIPGAQSQYWSLAHGIIRQESSFDRAAVSGAGARGMMQLMVPTARQVAGKLGVSYDNSRLTGDPSFNVLLGTQHFADLMNYWGNYAPLAVAAYNAGSGNVNKWIAANGDPRRGGIDIVKWIEDIPFTETRGYVQRVLENTVVYDAMHPSRARSTEPVRLSYYLGKSSRPG